MIHSLTDTIALNEQASIPGFGLGVFQIPDEEVATVVKNGILKGYRLIDTAQIYDNERGTGQGIKEGLAATGLTREDLFVTSKVWNTYLTYEETIAAFEKSLARLQLDYLDLYLLHWPGKNAYQESWRALEDLQQAGKIKAIGVSNFQIHHLKDLLATAKVKPVLNQVELHPKLAQKELRDYCQQQGIKIQAWSPLMQGQILQHPTLVKIAQSHQVSPAQIALRWHIQQEILLVVKTVNPDRMEQNQQLFDFSLSKEEMQELNRLNEDHRVGPDPDQFNF
ncbi:aldo/keto reductase [Enterococcus sp.]|uniref:aldo/keto reductase n=1 Tax=Enterococcus sp. TaxID=35783 RepID=UPI0025C0736B|nr:aldo/keto reductase [Enterococcus sp.]